VALIGYFLFAFFLNLKKVSNRSLIAISYFSFAWTAAILAFRLCPYTYYQVLLGFNRLFIVAAAGIATSFLHFSLTFPQTRSKKWGIWLIHLPILITAVIVFIPRALISEIVLQSWGKESHLGYLYPIYGLFIVLYFLVGIGLLVTRYLGASDVQERRKVFWILLATISTGTVDIFFNLLLILMGNYKYIWVGPLSALLWVCLLGYTTTKHRTLEIKILITRAIAVSITFIAVTMSIFFALLLQPPWNLLGLTILIFFWASFGHPMVLKVQTPLKKVFLRGYYEPTRIISKIAEDLVYLQDRFLAMKSIGETFSEHLELEYVISIFRDSEHSDQFVIMEIDTDHVLGTLPETSAFLVNIVDQKDPRFWTDIIDSAENLAFLNIKLGSLVVPVQSFESLHGVLILGPKMSEKSFDDEDLQFLSMISSQIITVFDRIQFQEKLIRANDVLVRLNTELEEKVRQAVALAQKHFHQAVFSTLASGMAHEIRNPMAAMVAGAGFLAESFDGRKRNPFEEYGAWERDITASDFADVASNDMDKASRILAALITRGVLPEAPKIAHLLETPVALDDFDSEFVADIGAIRGVLRYLTLMGELFEFVNIVNQQIPRILSITDNMMRYGVSGGGVGRDSFTKIPGISESQSAEIFDSLRHGGMLDPRGGVSPTVPLDAVASMRSAIERCLPDHLRAFAAGIVGVVWNTPGAIKRPVQVAVVLDHSLSLVDGNCKKKRILIERDIPANLPLVAGDEHRLQQAFFNILYNAIQALETVNEKNRRLTVRALITRFPVIGGHLIDGIEIQIQDTGPGIPSETKEKIFNPFFTTKGPTGGKNIGLGLSILSEVVSAHNGYIDVESELGVGTLFRIYLPKLG